MNQAPEVGRKDTVFHRSRCWAVPWRLNGGSSDRDRGEGVQGRGDQVSKGSAFKKGDCFRELQVALRDREELRLCYWAVLQAMTKGFIYLQETGSQ